MIRFAYYSTNPDDFRRASNGGCRVNEAFVEHTSGGNDAMAARGAEVLNLKPGKYVAIQAESDRNDVVIGFGWIVEVAPPSTAKAWVIE